MDSLPTSQHTVVPPSFTHCSTMPPKSKPTPAGRTGAGAGAPSTEASSDHSLSLSLYSSCSALLAKLMTHRHGWLFNEPVDVKKLRLKDYYAVVADTMDLGTVRCRLAKGRYGCPFEFASDVRLTFGNAMAYNGKGDTAYAMAEELLGIFESEWPSIEAQLCDGKIRKEIDPVKKQDFVCKVEVVEEEWETKPSKMARKV